MTGLQLLQQEQQSLLQAVMGTHIEAESGRGWQAGHPAQEKLARRGLRAYRANGEALAERALAAAYPVLAQLLGDENFAPMARQFWRQHPPSRGDMSCWGDSLAAFIDASPQLAGEPCLPDVARVEWALHRAATAHDATLDTASFGLLASADIGQLTLVLAPGFALLPSAWPVVSILQAHLTGHPTLEQAAERLRTGQHECALVWRRGFKPMVRQCPPDEQLLMAALAAGQSLDAALAALEVAGIAFDFSAWLHPCVTSGCVIGVAPLP